MAINAIKKGGTERIIVSALDEDNAYLSGLSDVLIQIQRKSDGYFFDFDDSIFKVSGWVTKQQAMSELSGLSGNYYYDFVIPNTNETYFIRITSATADNSPWDDEIKIVNTDFDTINSDLLRLLGLCKENQRISSPVYNSRGLLTSAIIKTYESASDCESDINALATYTVTATYSGTEMQSYKVVKN